MIKQMLLLASATAAICVAVPAMADTYAVDTSSDTTVSRSQPGGPIDTALSADDVYIRVFGTGAVDRGVWEYSLAGITPGVNVGSATASFYLNGTVVPGDMLLYGFAGTGTAGVADANLPITQIGSFTIGVRGEYNLSLSSTYIEGLINSGAQFLGLQMVSTGTGGFGPGGDFCSMESPCGGIAGSRLSINYDVATPAVPEPASWAMMIGGVGLMGGALRRRRKVSTRVTFA